MILSTFNFKNHSILSRFCCIYILQSILPYLVQHIIVYIVFSCGTCHLYVGKIYTNVLFVFCIKVPSATWHFTTGTFSHICVICFLHKGAICHMALYNTKIFSFLCSAERCHLHNCKYLINYQVLIIDPTIYDKDWCEVHLSKKA